MYMKGESSGADKMQAVIEERETRKHKQMQKAWEIEVDAATSTVQLSVDKKGANHSKEKHKERLTRCFQIVS